MKRHNAFRPTRTSPPLKPIASLVPDVSHSSAATIPDFIGLSHDEIDVLDAVIQRAGHSATTFLSIFKAYNDVLSERGLDPHEVLYYGKLLKIGTLKGRSWGDKWAAVKSQHGYQSGSNASDTRTQSQVSINLYENASKRADIQTMPSHRHIGSAPAVPPYKGSSETPGKTAVEVIGLKVPRYPRLVSRQRHQTDPTKSKVAVNETRSSLFAAPPVRKRDLRQVRLNESGAPGDDDASDLVEGTPFITPPPYRATSQDMPLPEIQPLILTSKTITPTIPFSSTTARRAVAIARERRGSVVNEDDAWNKIKMERDEKDADDFRTDRIIERCWEVWKEGLKWIITTNQQIGEARDNLLVRQSLQKWRSILGSRTQLYQSVMGLSNKRRLRVALGIWKAKLREAQQSKWRNGMRLKMKTIKERREMKLGKDAWAKWRQAYRSHISHQHYSERLAILFFNRWRMQLFSMDRVMAAADQHIREVEDRRVKRYWYHWKQKSELELLARATNESLDLRLARNTMDLWRKKARDRNSAKEFYCSLLMKTSMKSWKTSRDRIRALEHRADKHLSRQDGVLVRAVSRVWKARERGRLLERVKALRLTKEAWVTWTNHIKELSRHEDIAIAFYQRPNAPTITAAFHSWYQVHVTHQNARNFAVQYYHAQLYYKVLLSWRINLRNRLNVNKIARTADRFFTSRKAWGIWRGALDVRARERALKDLETRRLLKIFQDWLLQTRRKTHQRLSEQTVQSFVTKRILKNVLSSWTNRVIEVKLREFEVAQRCEISIQVLAFKKWKAACVRHAEELSLMESYRFVKREENIRRVFHRWFSLARTTRHRRLTLQQKEDDVKFSIIVVAWEKWRDLYNDEKLRPIEHNVATQTQKNLLFGAFGMWHSKTKTLPAIRFHADNAKRKYFALWRRAMPKVLQAKAARQKDRKAVLSKFLDQWVQSHRTKMALKAVVRARYLRLPTATPRQGAVISRAMPVTAISRSPKLLPRRMVEDRVNDKETRSTHTEIFMRPSTSRFSKNKPQSESGASHPASQPRDPSPTGSTSSFGGRRMKGNLSPTRSNLRPPSSTGGEVGRSRLWLELREVQRKSRPSSQHSPT